jgi:NAD(P)-dependent dehydrogenase (short-subunit alcohol dehydrogenase family)
VAVLAARGDDVIGVDLRGADVVADLSSDEGRTRAAEEVLARCDGKLEGAVACAGIGGVVNPGSLVMSVNYFGAVHFLQALRPALAKGEQPAAVAIASNSTTLMPNLPAELIDACLDGGEELARELGDKHGWAAYGASKTALSHWLRRAAVGADWAGAGICLNAVAPGRVLTALDDAQRADERLRAAVENLPIPVGGPAKPSEIAEFVAFLLSDKGRFFCGSVLFQDGGTDALVRPTDWPVGYTGAVPDVLLS